jgi:hypothetical protein
MSLLFQLWSDESDSEGTTIKGNHTPFSSVVYNSILQSLTYRMKCSTFNLIVVLLIFFPHSLPQLGSFLGAKAFCVLYFSSVM